MDNLFSAFDEELPPDEIHGEAVVNLDKRKIETDAGLTKRLKTDEPVKVPAKVYPFELDGFQKESIAYLERNESVLVAAHTSAGKTTVAEYAIAMALRDKQRVIYTSPIKALSNQKYRDLVEEFSDVGLMTGDVTINPNASCLVMTTEILRSMLYRGSEVIREVAYAVFDEVHYMRDLERGVVWEESIVLLPHKVRYVFLSATIPNAQQFCDWISKVHHHPCHAVYTDFRPTPLEHYVYPSGSTGVFLIVDEAGKFHDDTFQKAMATMSTTSLEDQVLDGGNTKDAKKRMAAKRRDKVGDLMSIVTMIMKRNYDPAIVFSFSKKDCEKYAAQVAKLSFTTPEEKQMINQVFKNAIESLNDDDKNLPQVRSLLPLLEKGIGIHHGGLLPLLKEVTEILFGEGLLKVLFATETFAMGINMPAKTVVFTSMRKYDGHDFRWVNAGEYIQMSGRAGRRGLDERGIVIQMMEEQMENVQAKEIMSGEANPLTSTFHLGYNMLLNLMRVEDANPEFIIKNSLYTFQQETAVPKLEASLVVLEEELSGIVLKNEELAARWFFLNVTIKKTQVRLRQITIVPDAVWPFLKEGRLVQVDEWGWGVIVAGTEGDDTKFSVVVSADPSHGFASHKPYCAKLKGPGPIPVMKVMSFESLGGVSTLRVHVPKKTNTKESLDTIHRSLIEVLRRFNASSVPLLDPVRDFKLDAEEIPAIILKLEKLKESLAEDPFAKMPESDEKTDMHDAFMKRYNLRMQMKYLKADIREKKTLPMKDKLESMKVVLRRLGHTDKDNVIQLKGRVACEVSTADELIITELLLGGAFNELSPATVASVLSCLVFQESSDMEAPENLELVPAYRTLIAAAKRVAEVQRDANIQIDPEEFAKSFKCDLMEAVYQWCNGAKFQDICGLTSVFEGSIIRCVRRLVELLRQLCVAAKVIGNPVLEQIFAKAVEMMKRDIIFAASLYL